MLFIVFSVFIFMSFCIFCICGKSILWALYIRFVCIRPESTSSFPPCIPSPIAFCEGCLSGAVYYEEIIVALDACIRKCTFFCFFFWLSEIPPLFSPKPNILPFQQARSRVLHHLSTPNRSFIRTD